MTKVPGYGTGACSLRTLARWTSAAAMPRPPRCLRWSRTELEATSGTPSTVHPVRGMGRHCYAARREADCCELLSDPHWQLPAVQKRVVLSWWHPRGQRAPGADPPGSRSITSSGDLRRGGGRACEEKRGAKGYKVGAEGMGGNFRVPNKERKKIACGTL